MLRVGLTGGIGTGKSHVLRRMGSAPNVSVLDLDKVAHAALAPGGSAAADVVAAFGPGILGIGGAIDRRRLGAIVFADPAARERLNAIVHPRVRAAESAWVAEHARESALLVTDAALLVETGLHLRFDRLVVTYCPEEMQVARVQARDGLAAETARARVAAQMSSAQKREFAHHVVDTTGRVEETDAQVDAVLRRLQAEVQRPPRESVSRAQAERLLATSPAGGLDARAVLRHTLRVQGIDIAALARAIGAEGPWYQVGERAPLGGDGFAEGIALWAVTHRGDDPEWLASAAGSLARLALPPGAPRAAAVLRTLQAASALTVPGRVAATELARKWGGAEPGPLAPRGPAAGSLDRELLDALLS